MDGTKSEIEVLAKCRGLLKCIDLCRKAPFQIIRLKIPNNSMFIFNSIPIFFGILMESLTVYDIGWNIIDAAGIVLLIFGLVQILSIYFSLAHQNEHIIEMIDRMQEVVNQSELKG